TLHEWAARPWLVPQCSTRPSPLPQDRILLEMSPPHAEQVLRTKAPPRRARIPSNQLRIGGTKAPRVDQPVTQKVHRARVATGPVGREPAAAVGEPERVAELVYGRAQDLLLILSCVRRKLAGEHDGPARIPPGPIRMLKPRGDAGRANAVPALDRDLEGVCEPQATTLALSLGAVAQTTVHPPVLRHRDIVAAVAHGRFDTIIERGEQHRGFIGGQ